jgi:hypothetical protein
VSTAAGARPVVDGITPARTGRRPVSRLHLAGEVGEQHRLDCRDPVGCQVGLGAFDGLPTAQCWVDLDDDRTIRPLHQVDTGNVETEHVD